MAKVKLNPIIDQVHGTFGDLVFRRVEGQTVIARRPDTSGVTPTPGQEAQRARFRDAAFYGRVVMQDPDALAFYEAVAARRRKPVFAVIVGDFLNAPVVDAIDADAYTGTTGDPLVIRAHDDVEVTGVTVVIADADGNVLESGPAAPDEWRWRYVAQTDVPAGTEVDITATATDRPGNTGSLSVKVMVPA
jgi:hypothetical protein